MFSVVSLYLSSILFVSNPSVCQRHSVRDCCFCLVVWLFGCLFCRNLFLVLVYVVTSAFVFRDHHWHGVVSMEYIGSFEEYIGVVWGREGRFG